MTLFVTRSVPSLLVILFCALVADRVCAQGKTPLPIPHSAAKTARDYFREGRSLEEKKNYQGAVESFQRAVAMNPKERSYFDNLGFCLKQLYRYQEAMTAFNQAIALDEQDSYAYRNLGLCYFEKKDYDSAVSFMQAAISLDPSEALNHRYLGYIYYQKKNGNAAIAALDEALKLEPDDFDANYWRGMAAFGANAFADASRFLEKATYIRPDDFNANFWNGMSLVRERKFKEAVARFEKASELRPDDRSARFELFASYFASNQPEKAGRIYPAIMRFSAVVFVFIYCVWLAILLPFSLPVRARTFPGFWFSIAWVGLFIEGQAAFLFLLAALPPFGFREVVLTGAMIAGLPIVAVGFWGFARQPWGEPFKWPPRFGDAKTIVLCVLSIFGMMLIAGAFAHAYVVITHKPFPLQRTIPLIRAALQANPIVAWIAVTVVIPCVEEILFRGLLFGALQKFMGVTAAAMISSFLFVCVHLQLVGLVLLFLLGLILAWARLRSGSLGLPIALHALNNAIALSVLMFAPLPKT